MKNLLNWFAFLTVPLLASCATSWNFKEVMPFDGDVSLCGPMPTEDEQRAAADEFIAGNFWKYPDDATVSSLAGRQPEPVELMFVNGESSVYGWRVWLRITRKISSGGAGYTGAQEYSFIIRNGLRLASWFPPTTQQGDGGMPAFSFAPKFKERDGRQP